MTSGKKSSTNYFLTDTVGQNAPGLFSSTGYQVRSGFQYIYDLLNSTFSFEISSLDISFGSLVSGVGTTRSHTITISTPSGHGYEINVAATSQLTNSTGATIPPASCDSGPCTPTSSQLWNNASAHGFGFNAVGLNSSGVATNIGTSQFFATSSHFRPFALSSDSATPPTIMSETVPVKSRPALITYKINPSPQQAEGNYYTAIIFTAIPNF